MGHFFRLKLNVVNHNLNIVRDLMLLLNGIMKKTCTNVSITIRPET